MLLAIDIGNTNLVLGCIKNDLILFHARIATDRLRTSDQYGIEIKSILEAYGVPIADIENCIIASVVPPVFHAVCTGVRKVIGKEPIVVDSTLNTGLDIRTDAPEQVGSDRIVTAAAALANHQAPLIVMDLGTATTIDVIAPSNHFLGGMILPGVTLSLDALTRHAAQLPEIHLEKPNQLIGKNTLASMCSGVMYGTAAALDGLIARIEEELGCQATVVATGGIAPSIIPLCKHKIFLEQDLLLQGLNLLYKWNC